MDEAINGCLSITDASTKLDMIGCEDYVVSSAVRLLKAWKRYNDDFEYQVDFELLLRDYVLCTKTKIIINDYVLSEVGKEIGLYSIDNVFFCKNIFPDYCNKKFCLKSAEYFDCTIKENKNYFLGASPLIKKITKEKFNSFKSEEQKLCVEGALKVPFGYSCLISMPTGGGKSLVIQSLAVQKKEGLTIVVVPTISLMLDQYKNAKEILNLDDDEICFYHGEIDSGKVVLLMKKHKLRLLFMSPESLIKNPLFKQTIITLAQENYINNIVVDEAHIILEWGDSFRLDFQCLDVFCKNLQSVSNKIRVYLLSATFRQQDVKYLRELYSVDGKWLEFRCDSLRKEIHYNFIKANSFTDKNKKMVELIKFLPHPMIIYVNRPDEAKRVRDILKKAGINNVNIFTGETSSSERNKLIDKWKDNDFSIMVATCAFGVGVDKKDVRTVLHLYVPDNASKYYQEAGRGGRDGKACLSVMLYIEDDFDLSFSFIKKKVLTSKKIIARWFSMLQSPKTIRYGNGILKLDSSIVPSYYDDDEFVIESNSKHIGWNVYVILFLKRHNLIDVLDVEFKDDNYLLTIKLNDHNLLNNNEDLNDKIEELRNKEWLSSEKGFLEIKKSIEKSDTECISDLFLRTYSLIPNEICSGCNSHDNMIIGKYNGLPLVSSSKFISKHENSSFFDNYELLIVRTDDVYAAELALAQKAFVIFVQNKEKSIDSEFDNIIISYEEYYHLLDENMYFFDSVVVFECPTNEYNILKLLASISKLRIKKIKIIILTKENYFIESRNKYLYEMIEAPYKEFYMIEKELR